MSWWFNQPGRALTEKAAIADLAEQADWLVAPDWTIDKEFRLSVRFELHYAGKLTKLQLQYPSVFPDIPAQIRPIGLERLSGHQYGAGGELCLEYRPDNWDPSVTGAMMIESAYRLLLGETPVDGALQEVPSAQRMSLGQDIRNQSFRFVLPEQVRSALLAASISASHELEILEHRRATRWISHISKVGKDADIYMTSATMAEWVSRQGHYVRLTGPATASALDELTDLAKLMISEGHALVAKQLTDDAAEYPLLIERAGEFYLRSAATLAGERKIIAYRTIMAPPEAPRLPTTVSHLQEKKVGMVGCGSVGSKVAISLARSGVEHFVLVDGDVFFEGNLVRNALDRRAIGLNKPDALKSAILEIAPSAEILSYRIELGGQESSSFVEGAITALRSCDALVDATAEPGVFNMLGGIAQRANKPFLFAEVFGGGFGGMVARLRPGKEPVPQNAKAQIEDWCEKSGMPAPLAGSTGYGTAGLESAAPLIADDTAVSVIAAHLASMSLDALGNSDSRYPHPVYMIGLQAEWIFQAPFEVWPIDLILEGDWGRPAEANQKANLEAFIADIVESQPKAESPLDEA